MESAKPQFTAESFPSQGVANHQVITAQHPGYQNPQAAQFGLAQAELASQPRIVIQIGPQMQPQRPTETYVVEVEGDHSYLVNGTGLWVSVIVLIVIYYPLLWVPVFMDNLKNNVFECPKCGIENCRGNAC